MFEEKFYSAGYRLEEIPLKVCAVPDVWLGHVRVWKGEEDICSGPYTIWGLPPHDPSELEELRHEALGYLMEKLGIA